MSKLQIEYENKDGIKLTRYQKNQVVRIVKGHVEDLNYHFSSAKVWVCKYFVSVYFYYYPKDAVDNPYVAVMKNFYVGPKGGIQRAVVRFGIGDEHNIRKIAEYYFKAEEN